MSNDIKDKVKEKYGRVALLQESCCAPGGCGCSGTSRETSEAIGYNARELASVPQESILGAGCGAPLNFAALKEGETVVDLGSGAGIDVFLSANKVGKTGRAIGIDMTDEMLEKARKNAQKGRYSNVEFRRGDIEEHIPVDDRMADVVISNCVINLTVDKVRAFSEVRRILRDGGRVVISDMVADRPPAGKVDPEKWCSCIDGALTKDDYIASIKKAGFENVAVLQERPYVDESDGRKIASIVVKAVK
jgi:SAM-dependent methyltransferase